jgi:hypothetical protein
MGELMGAQEVEGWIARLVAEQTAQLLRELDDIEGRLDSVEATIRDGIARSLLH